MIAITHRGMTTFVFRRAIRRVYPPAPLQEEPTLNLGQFHGCRAFLVVVHHVVDPSADGIVAHQPRIAGLQEFGRRTHIPHPRIEPKFVTVGIKDYWHSVVDRRRYSAVEEAKQSYESAIQRDANNVSAKKQFDGFVAECNRQGSELPNPATVSVDDIRRH